jgi:FKBP-type peptidyl-prolyl cis-trans isomerase
MVKSGVLFFFLSFSVFILSCKSEKIDPETEKKAIKAYVSKYKKSNTVLDSVIIKSSSDTNTILYVLFTKLNSNKADTLSNGKSVTINSVGKFLDGAIFDDYPQTFVLGSGTIITGLDVGVTQMKKGEKAVIIFTSSIGYGATKPYGSVNAKGRLVMKDNTGKIEIDTTTKLPKFTYVDIPADTPLAFEVEVVK